MITSATALLLTTVGAATQLRKLEEGYVHSDGQWYPDRCADIEENCAI